MNTLADEPRRSVTNKITFATAICDNNLAAKWYRFQINGIDSKIPTACPATEVTGQYICGTAAPGWFNGR